MSSEHSIGLEEALSRMFDRLRPLGPVDLAVEEAGGLVTADDCIAAVDCPSASVSLKDGYAVQSGDLANASEDHPVKLRVCGTSVAGGDLDVVVESGTCVKIMTGARVPLGADAVIAEEFTQGNGACILCHRDASERRNVIGRGYDVKKGDVIARRGRIITPAVAGLLAAGGLSKLRVYRKPRIGLIATGDEVVAPGRPLKIGQLYASNIVTLLAWLRHFRMDAATAVVPDQPGELRKEIEVALEHVDVLVTSGGAWKSDRDLTVRIFADMGAEVVFRHVRMGPGKAVALVIVNNKAVFCLPGVPTANEMAFLQVALPGLMHLMAKTPIPFEYRAANLTETVGRDKSWTQFFYASMGQDGARSTVAPIHMSSRLQSQASADAIIKVPEGVERLEGGEQIQVQILHSRY